jgi:hypothetical protein
MFSNLLCHVDGDYSDPATFKPFAGVGFSATMHPCFPAGAVRKSGGAMTRRVAGGKRAGHRGKPSAPTRVCASAQRDSARRVDENVSSVLTITRKKPVHNLLFSGSATRCSSRSETRAHRACRSRWPRTSACGGACVHDQTGAIRDVMQNHCFSPG